MRQKWIDIRPWIPLIAMVTVTVVPFILFGIKWGFHPPIFPYPIPLPLPIG